MSVENVRRAIHIISWGVGVTFASLFAPIMIRVGPPLYNWLSPWGYELESTYGDLVFRIFEGELTPLYGYWITFASSIAVIIYLLRVKNPKRNVYSLLLLLAMFGPYISYITAMITTPEIVESLRGNLLVLLTVPIWVYLLPMPGLLLFCSLILFLRALTIPIGKYKYEFRYVPYTTH